MDTNRAGPGTRLTSDDHPPNKCPVHVLQIHTDLALKFNKAVIDGLNASIRDLDSPTNWSFAV